MSNDLSSALDQKASRVATVGVVAGMALTAAGMMIHSPILGGLGLASLAIIVIFRRPLARLLPPH